MAAYIVFGTGQTFGPSMLYPVYRSVVHAKRYLSCIVHYYGWQISKITFGINAKYYTLIGFF